MKMHEPPSRELRPVVLRMLVALAAALSFALAVYAMLQMGSTPARTGLVSFTFLLILPAALSAFVAYMADPWGERSFRFYMLVPAWLLGSAVVAAILFLHEGAVCIIILSPLWLAGGLGGASAAYHLRRRVKKGRTYCCALMVAPFVALQVEATLSPPTETAAVSRSIVVEAGAAKIWPLLRGIPDVRRGEGRWNISQDLVGVPRPRGARLVGEGVGAERLANWTGHISFRERITEWQVGRRIGWRFIFDDTGAWDFTDRHLMPDSAYFRVTTGGYNLTPLGANRTRVTLDTRYWMRTPVNGYSRLWGEFFLGDLETNLLALVKQRAETST